MLIDMKLLWLACAALTAAAPVQLPKVPGGLTKWTGNHLVDMQGANTSSIVFRIYSREGNESRIVPFLVPGGARIADFAMNGSGLLAAVGTGARRSFVAVIPPNGVPNFIDTGAYQAAAIAVEKSGNMWTLGRDPRRDTSVLRHWSQNGELLEGLLRGTDFKYPLMPGGTDAQLLATGRGLYIFLPRERRVMRIEDAVLVDDIRDISLPDAYVKGLLAITDDGAIFASAVGGKANRGAFAVRLDTSARRWVPTVPLDDFVSLYGADGAKLVGRSHRPFDLMFWDVPK